MLPLAHTNVAALATPSGASKAAGDVDAARARTLTESATSELALARDPSENAAALLDHAQASLRQAMEVRPDSASAIHGLAWRQLEVARRAGSGTFTPPLTLYRRDAPVASRQGLDLAQRILELGLAQFPDDARFHNTAGLVAVELQEYGRALRHFDSARRLSPNFESAHFNYAALAFELRDYAASERAYREVLRVAPTCYEAMLGLALAKGGALEPKSSESQMLEVMAILRNAKQLEPARPEAYFNAALFVSEVLARGTTDITQALRYVYDATCLFDQFLMRADPHWHRQAIDIARSRTLDMTDALKFLPGGRSELHDCTRSVL